VRTHIADQDQQRQQGEAEEGDAACDHQPHPIAT
jgi:hypothetical protein